MNRNYLLIMIKIKKIIVLRVLKMKKKSITINMDHKKRKQLSLNYLII